MQRLSRFSPNRRRAAQVIGLAPFALAGTAWAQQYPARPVKIIVPYGPGTVSDMTARLVAERLSELWGMGVVVENQAGAGGSIGTNAIARATGDGYTLGMLASNHAMNAALYQNLPYDPVKDFKFLVHTTFNQFAFCAHPSLPVQSLRDLINLAKEKPGQITYGSSGNGGSPHLAMAKLAHMAGIQMRHIPYKTNGAAVTDVLSGQVMLISTSISVLAPHAKAGKLRALAVSGQARSSILPDTPTVAEAGVEAYSLTNWNGLVAPAQLPGPLGAKIQADVMSILKDPRTIERVAALGAEIDALGSGAFEQKLVAEIASWAEIVRVAGIKLD
jgi:tripartite-type tricarboxylate transporter receptor subunit TctC